jgi:hypothetical protein
MNKKAITASAALLAFTAFLAVASPASAVQLTYPTGTKLPIGGNLLFTNVGSVLFRGPTSEVQECPKSTMTGTLPRNGPEDITAEITSWALKGTGREEMCTLPPLTNATYMKVTTDYEASGKKVGLPYCLTTTAGTDKWVMRGGSCSSASRPIKFKLDFYNEDEKETLIFVGTCAYEKANINGTFTTDTGSVQDALLTFNQEEPFKRIEVSTILLSSTVCRETMELITTFTMETDTTSASDPIYIS